MTDELRIAGLVVAAKKGDEHAFRELLEAHRGAITSTLLACGVRCQDTALDLAQETALRAWTRLDSLRVSGTFSPWIRRIAANAARDYLRRVAVRKEEELDVARHARSEDDPHDLAEREEEVRLMQEALAEEESEIRDVLLAQAHGESGQSISQRLGVSPDALKMRVLRARKRLRTRLRTLKGDE